MATGLNPKDPRCLVFVHPEKKLGKIREVRGEIVMLQKLFSGQKVDDVLAFDVEQFFRRIGLDRFLTAQRRNGLGSMIQRIRQIAQQIKAGK